MTPFEAEAALVLGDLPGVVVCLIALGYCAFKYPADPLRHGVIGAGCGVAILLTVTLHVVRPLAMQHAATARLGLPLIAGAPPVLLLFQLVDGIVMGLPFAAVAVAGTLVSSSETA